MSKETPETPEIPKITEQDARALQETIDSLDDPTSGLGDISEMDPEQLEEVVRVIRGTSQEAFDIRNARRKVRYKLYRLRTEAEGKSGAQEIGPEFRRVFESQPEFKGWRFFGHLWDVSLIDPYIVVGRDFTEEEEWASIVRAKFPHIVPDGSGRVVYPDIVVKERVLAASKKMGLELQDSDSTPPDDESGEGTQG